MAAWLDRSKVGMEAIYAGPLDVDDGRNIPEPAPSANDFTKAHILIDGDNILGPCIVDFISITGGTGVGNFQIWDADAAHGKNVQFMSFDSASPPYGTYEVGPLFCGYGIWCVVPSGLLCSIGYR